MYHVHIVYYYNLAIYRYILSNMDLLEEMAVVVAVDPDKVYFSMYPPLCFYFPIFADYAHNCSNNRFFYLNVSSLKALANIYNIWYFDNNPDIALRSFLKKYV